MEVNERVPCAARRSRGTILRNQTVRGVVRWEVLGHIRPVASIPCGERVRDIRPLQIVTYG